MAIIKVGQEAPDFTLVNQNEKEIKLSDFRGKQVVLSWHPLAFTSVCTDQMRDLERNFEKFTEKNTIALGISIDHVPAKHLWATMLSMNETNILADFKPFGGVSKTYGVFNDELGASGRAVVIVDEKGIVKWVKDYPLGQLPDVNEILAQL